jgi:hypothetical protein
MQQHEQATLDSIEGHHLVQLVHRFRAQIDRRDRHDGEVVAGLVRMLRRGGPDVEELCRLIGQQHHGANVRSNNEERAR